MSCHQPLIGGDDADTFSSGDKLQIFISHIPWSGWFGEKFDMRNIIYRIEYLFEDNRDVFFYTSLYLYDFKILDETILLKKLQNRYLECRKNNIFYSRFPCHIGILYPDQQIMDRRINIGHYTR
jgi:hypothetical protein